MKGPIALSLALCATVAMAVPRNPVLWGKSTCSSKELGLPSKGMRGYNGIYWGFNPDDDPFVSMKTINGWTGKKASTYGLYSQINSKDSYNGEQLTAHIDDIVASGAVLIAHVMPTGLNLNEVNSNIGGQIAKVIKQFTDRGVEVWLRFGHEMNWYTTGDARYHGNFINAWKVVHQSISDAHLPGVMMFWSPNIGTPSDLQQWWPGADYVDIVGMDYYPPDTSSTFASVFDAFYNTFAKGYNKHMALGETSARSNDPAVREAWVRQLANTDLSRYPCFKSVTWFEFEKDEPGPMDYRIVMGQSADTLKQTLSNFA